MSSAQRLSASKDSPLRKPNEPGASIACSTPVGVKGFSTRAAICCRFLDLSVLNACRRQRILHVPGQCGGRPIPAGAQRLSASKDSPRYRTTGLAGLPIRAQRLSASKDSPLVMCLTLVVVDEGAQRLSASKDSPPSRPDMPRAHRSVLNACRRQRILHCSRLTATKWQKRCSTPVGVKGFSTRERRVRWRPRDSGAQRLSASKDSPRLHRSSTSRDSEVCSTPVGVKGFSTQGGGQGGGMSPACSTPVGVKGFSTSRRQSRIRFRFRAQRLSASKDSPLVEGDSVTLQL